MKRTLQMVLAKNIALAEIAILSLLAPAALAASVEAHSARKVLDATGVKGGLVVHIGCGDGKLTAALRANDSTIVHGLDIDEANVAAARRTASKAGLYGTVSAARLVGRSLPYADNLVNLVVSENLGKVTMAEVMRVLVPNGAAYVKTGGSWRKTVKPRPAEIDEWTHFLHDASNNAVAADTQVGPPRRLQWTAGPPWCRSHEYISSFSAMVTAGGRVFYVVDEALLGVTDKRLGERWALNARDAFNGALLWKRRLPKWRADEWKGTSMRGRPPSVPRRIVAGGDKLYATLSHLAPVSVIDGATGKTLQMLDGTAGAQEIALVDGTLVMRAVDTAVRGEKTTASIVAVDTETGKVRWRVRAPRYLSQSLAAAGERAVYSDGAQTVCLSLADGKELWRSARPEAKTPPKQQPKAKKKRPRRTRRGDRTIIVHGDLVLETDGGSIIARHARTGKTRWTARTGGGSMRGHDFFIARGLAWHAAKGGISAYDLATGKVVKTIDPSAVQSRGHHLRCYRAKATERYLITQFSGAEFISLTDENHSQNDWVRGPCRHGIMPANGMLYTPPHQCFCFPGAMMTGLNAFTTANDDAMHAIAPSTGAALEKGPAFGTIGNRKSKIANSADWPVYRHDARRTGATPCEVPAKVARLWRAKLVGPLTPPVAAGGRIYVAARNEHTVYALSAADGSVAWRFTADAGVDSPPTVHAGAVLFGCADGRVYCIRASDGALAWRFRAAPAERLIMDEGRLASAWRVHGSVIVQDGVLYCTAGRSSFIDGGLYVYALDPATGKVRHTCRLDTSWATREDKVGDQTQ
ncbi:MAG: PQQ-binding-like beta-propeller repeat protein, partial [Phycisphaerae bacterium]|nr:PQQ-binding-like beta-propeller repeat protein [Phycisphaerae bacterium]